MTSDTATQERFASLAEEYGDLLEELADDDDRALRELARTILEKGSDG